MTHIIKKYQNLVGVLALTLCTNAIISYGETKNQNVSKKADSETVQNKSSNHDSNGNSNKSFSKDEEDDPEIEVKRKEQRRLELENSLARLRLEKELMVLRIEIERMRAERELINVKWEVEQEKNVKQYQKAIQELNQQRDKILAELALSQAEFSKTQDNFNKEYTKNQNELMRSRVSVDQIKTDIDSIKAHKEQSMYVKGGATYLEEPLQKDGTLVISDRVIHLNGPIYGNKASHIVDRISYFNNKDSKKPIFLIINSSPGGSVQAGFVILQAMQNSQAPVHVIVKSMAASMAALIATLAKKSYIFPNANILHHQPWTWSIGNVRELKETLDYMQELWKRLGGEVAKKMHISLNAFNEKLYKKSSTGDWLEFGDNAKKIKWVDHVINRIDDTSLRQMPDPNDYTWKNYWKQYYDLNSDEALTAEGKVILPPLIGNDFYYLYNAQNAYQLAGYQK